MAFKAVRKERRRKCSRGLPSRWEVCVPVPPAGQRKLCCFSLQASVSIKLCRTDEAGGDTLLLELLVGLEGGGTSKNLHFSLKRSGFSSELQLVVFSVIYSFTRFPLTEYRLSFMFAVFQGHTHTRHLSGRADTSV